jgi:uncharacterized membrane protein YeaQ/YmgE (transglycosylase-associated protein family)
MDLTFVGWIVIGLIAGLFSAVVTGGRTPRGWIPSLIIGVIAAWLVGWLVTSFTNWGALSSFWISALLATGVAVVLRLLMKSFDFAE